MIAIKFENEKVVSWKYPCLDLQELRPSKEGFALYDWDGVQDDIIYLRDVGGQLMIDVQAKQEAEIKTQAKRQIVLLKAELVKIKEDIEQETFGLIRNDYATKKSRAAEIVNELRALEGKEPREIEGDIL